jgi:hypothetical protein
MPTFAAGAPWPYYDVPAEEREKRCSLGSDDCVIDEESFFVRGCLDIPVIGEQEPFSWGVWVSLSEDSFREFVRYFDKAKRSHVGPFFGWLAAELPLYPSTLSLKTRAHFRDNGIRPYIEVEPTDHPLALEQRNGISVTRLAEIYAYLEHRPDRD